MKKIFTLTLIVLLLLLTNGYATTLEFEYRSGDRVGLGWETLFSPNLSDAWALEAPIFVGDKTKTSALDWGMKWAAMKYEKDDEEKNIIGIGFFMRKKNYLIGTVHKGLAFAYGFDFYGINYDEGDAFDDTYSIMVLPNVGVGYDLPLNSSDAFPIILAIGVNGGYGFMPEDTEAPGAYYSFEVSIGVIDF